MSILRAHKSIAAAIAANVLIAAIKFAAAATTGSSAIMAEGMHSLVDMGNGLLLLHGVRRAIRPPDDRHPFGHSQELYFWTLIVAILIFGLGGGVSLYEGLTRLQPHEVSRLGLGFAILGASMLFEGTSLRIAIREFRRDSPRGSLWEAMHSSRDPTRFAVILEDVAAVAGLLVALLSSILYAVFRRPWLDGAGSIGVALILVGSSVVLMAISRSLLVGQALPEQARRRIARDIEALPGVERAELTTMGLGRHNILVAARIRVKTLGSLREAEALRERIRIVATQAEPDVKHIFTEFGRDPPAASAGHPDFD